MKLDPEERTMVMEAAIKKEGFKLILDDKSCEFNPGHN